MTSLTERAGWSIKKIKQREYEIEKVRKSLQVAPHHFFSLAFQQQN